MIIGSLLLILVAVVLLVMGLTGGSSVLLTGSIAASLLAAVALVVGGRQDTGAAGRYSDDATGDGDEETDTAGVTGHTRQYALAGAPAGRAIGAGPREAGGPGTESATVTLPVQSSGRTGYTTAPGDTYAGQAEAGRAEPGSAGVPARLDGPGVPSSPAGTIVAGDDQDLDEEDPPDEPAPQVVSAADAARVARLTTDVLVIDGRPRYHLPGCVHLLGRESEPLPVGEAVELGFTPCSLCEPDSALLTDPRLG